MRRIQYLDFLRIVCAAAVVLQHLTIAAISVFKAPSPPPPQMLKLFATISNLQQFAVPIFVMITGFLFLKDGKFTSMYEAINKYAKRIIVVILTMGVFFTLIQVYFETRTINLHLITSSVVKTFGGETWKHFWYLYMLVGLYLFLPMIQGFVARASKSDLWIMAAVLFMFTSLFPTIYNIFNIEWRLGIQFPVESVYVLYLLLGKLVIEKINIQRWSMTLLLSTVLGLSAFICFAGWSGYSNPAIVLFAVNIILISRKMSGRLDCWMKSKRWMQSASDSSFGIYIMHMLFINILYKVIHINPLNEPMLLFPLFFLVFLFSWITTIVIKRIPWYGKYF